jgi:hypothetical protein
MIGVAVNFFQKVNSTDHVEHSLFFCLSLLRLAPEITQIVVSDGSLIRNERVQSYCDERGVKYLHVGKEMSFAESYNAGIRHLTTNFICTLASDVFVRSDTFTKIKNFLSEVDAETLGAVIPYLSDSDLPGQASTGPGPIRVSPLMTLNLNVFPRAVLDAIGGVNDEFSGCYNDFIMAKKLTDLGRKIYLVDAYAVHYGRLTRITGTNVDYLADKDKFAQLYPELYLPGVSWDLDLTKFGGTSRFRRKFKQACLMKEESKWPLLAKLLVSSEFLRPLNADAPPTGARAFRRRVKKILRNIFPKEIPG